MSAVAQYSHIPVWLFCGPEIGLKNDAIAKHKNDAKHTFGDLDEYTFYAHETPVAQIVSLLQNGSLFSAARFAVVRNAELIKKKEDIALLKELVDAFEKQSKLPENDACVSWLFFVSDETSVDKKLENLIPKQNRTIFWELFDNQKTEWIQKFFSSMGFSVEHDAVDTILDLIEHNTETLRSECSRFALCFEKGHHITSDDVDNVLSHSRQESAFSLFAALCEHSREPAQRLTSSLDILQQIRNSKESSAVQCIAALSYCFRRLKAWHSLHASGQYISDFDLKIKGFASKKMQTQYARAARIWSIHETALCLALLSETDMKIRTTGTAVEHIELQQLIYALIIKKGCSPEA
ncbi:MAG: DNA polymerase III subunit delta [Spirochaetales bacterium]